MPQLQLHPLRQATCVVLLGVCSTAAAQLPPLLETTAQYLPESRIPDAGGLRAQVSSYDAIINVPLMLDEGTFLVPGAQYHVDSISYSRVAPGFTELRALHSVDLTLLLAQVLSDRWTLSVRAWPGVAGDFERLDSGLLHLGGLAMLSWSPRQRFTLGAGALGTYAFGELLPLPLIYMDWKPEAWFRLEASLPFSANVTFALGDRIELGAQADVNGNEYAIRDARVRESYPCRASATDDPATAADETRRDGASCVDHLAYSVAVVSGSARVRIISSVWLGASLGHTFFRRYELENSVGTAVPDGKVDLPNELVFRASLVVRIPIAE